MTALLHIQELSHNFGGLRAVSRLELTVQEGAIHGLIGPNGSGKTTTFNLITGLHTPATGRILLAGQEITGQTPARIVRQGVARTFQNLRIFANLSVLDNVRIARQDPARAGLFATVLRLPAHARAEAETLMASMALLELLNLAHRARARAGDLPYGECRRLEIARALATSPRLILLDEPAAGMNPREVNDLMELIRRIRDEFRITVLLIEHHMKFVTGLCEEVLVMDFGQAIATGSPGTVVRHPKVLEAYLGKGGALC